MNPTAPLMTCDNRSLPEAVTRTTELLGHALHADKVSLWCHGVDGAGMQCLDEFNVGAFSHHRGKTFLAAPPDDIFHRLEITDLIIDNHAFDTTGQDPVSIAQNALGPSALYAAIKDNNRVTAFYRAESDNPARRWSTKDKALIRNAASLLSDVFGPRAPVLEKEQLLQTISLLTGTLESTDEGIVVTGLDRLIMLTNHRFIEMLGRDGGDKRPLLGTRIKDCLLKSLRHPEEALAEVELLYANPDLQRLHCIEFIDGRIFERFSLPLRIEGTIAGRIFSYRDVTARVHNEKQREKLETQLRQSQKMEAVGTLATGIAHDFNNILSAIACNIRLARADVPRYHRAQQSLADITVATQRAGELIQQILTFGRHDVPQRKLVSLQPIIREVVGLIRASVPPAIAINTDLPEDLPAVMAAGTHVHQVMMNLCQNASHAIGNKTGTIDIKAQEVSIDESHDNTRANLAPGKYLLVAVSDTGCGMDPPTVDRMFEPFFTTRTRGKGAGLGLALVHGIMQGHGGGIAVASEPGKGTSIMLYFPIN